MQEHMLQAIAFVQTCPYRTRCKLRCGGIVGLEGQINTVWLVGTAGRWYVCFVWGPIHVGVGLKPAPTEAVPF